MRILLTGILIFVNFILQTTLLPYISIGGLLPNTALIIVVSYALLRGSTEGAIVGFFSGRPLIFSSVHPLGTTLCCSSLPVF